MHKQTDKSPSGSQGHLTVLLESITSPFLPQDKFYDTKYDVGDKHLQCGRRADVLKFWTMWKAKVRATEVFSWVGVDEKLSEKDVMIYKFGFFIL